MRENKDKIARAIEKGYNSQYPLTKSINQPGTSFTGDVPSTVLSYKVGIIADPDQGSRQNDMYISSILTATLKLHVEGFVRTFSLTIPHGNI